jgi:hypothetical protein
MIDTLELVDIVYQRLKGSSLDSAISGDVYKHKRPINSVLEDVVINSLPANNFQVQSAVVNVNVFVPNLKLRINNIQDNTQPDHVRLKALCALALDRLTDYWQDDFNLDIQQQMLLEDEASAAHYINIRLDFFNINL